MADAPFGAWPVGGSRALVALVGQDGPQRPAGGQENRQDTARWEAGGSRCRELQPHLSHGEGASGIAGGVLPNLADSLELTDDVERVQTDQLTWFAGPNVRRLALLSDCQLTSCPLGEQLCCLCTVDLGHGQALPARLQTSAAQQPVDCAGCHPQAAIFGAPQLVGELSRTPRRPGQHQGQDRPLVGHARQGWMYASRPLSARMQSNWPIHNVSLTLTVEERVRYAALSAGSGDVAKLLRPRRDAQSKCVYAIFRGHGSTSLPPQEEPFPTGRIRHMSLDH
jgi:hypothetical protein